MAIRAIQRFDEATRFDNDKRRELVAGLTDILSAEERLDLAAALQRRPIVQLGRELAFTQGHVLLPLVPGISIPPRADSRVVPPAAPNTPTSAP